MLFRSRKNDDVKTERRNFEAVIEKGSFVAGKHISNVIWPANALVTEVVRESGESVVPDGETMLFEGDKITIAVESSNFDETEEFVSHLVKKKTTEK